MPLTPYPDIDALLSRLRSQIQRVLDQNLIGLYLYGSLVAGDFTRGTSDIDLLAATATDIDEQEFQQLDKLHHDIATENPHWEGRLEIAYLSRLGLKTFRSKASQIAVISPGEPFHCKEAGKEWLINWWLIREQGLTLFGPLPTSLIAPISKAEFLQAVQEHALYWREWVQDARDRKGQSYAILTMCRALYASKHGEQVSKQQAARWTQEQLPEWAALIQKALEWRVAKDDAAVDQAATLPETKRFVHLIIDQVGS